MKKKKERRIHVFKKLHKLSEKEYRSLLDLMSFALMMQPIRLALDDFLRYSARSGATKEETYKFNNLTKEIEAGLYEKIVASGCWKYLRNYGTKFMNHFTDLYPPNYKGVSFSKIRDILFTEKDS